MTISQTQARQNLTRPSIGEALDKVLRQATRGPIVGAVVAVAHKGRVVYRGAAGFADREAGKPSRPDTLFRLASLTKLPTAVAALALAERGVISLDDPVTRHLPDFQPKLADGAAPVITLRQLVSHTAGLGYGFLEAPDGPYRQAGVSDGMDQPGLSVAANLARIASVPLAFEPGSRWSYSVGADVLGAAIAAAAGTTLPLLIKALVTDPLGLTDSGFAVRHAARLATPYADGSPAPARMGETQQVSFIGGGQLSFAPGRVFDASSYPSGGAGMVGTAGDYLAILEALRAGGGPLLSQASVDQLATLEDGDFDIFLPGWKWPLAFAVLDDPAKTGTPQSRGTWNWGGVYGASWFVDPARELSVVILTNTAAAGMLGPFPDAVRDAVYASI